MGSSSRSMSARAGAARSGSGRPAAGRRRAAHRTSRRYGVPRERRVVEQLAVRAWRRVLVRDPEQQQLLERGLTTAATARPSARQPGSPTSSLARDRPASDGNAVLEAPSAPRRRRSRPSRRRRGARAPAAMRPPPAAPPRRSIGDGAMAELVDAAPMAATSTAVRSRARPRSARRHAAGQRRCAASARRRRWPRRRCEKQRARRSRSGHEHGGRSGTPSPRTIAARRARPDRTVSQHLRRSGPRAGAMLGGPEVVQRARCRARRPRRPARAGGRRRRDGCRRCRRSRR